MHRSVHAEEGVVGGPQGLTESRVGAKPRVLIAEDEWAFRALLLWAFEEDGWEVVTARDGPTLLEILGSSMVSGAGVEPFDLVVSDVRMPGWNGPAALMELCRSSLMPPFVVITAFGSDDLHEQARRAGAVAVFDKPFDLADLTALGRRTVLGSRVCPAS